MQFILTDDQQALVSAIEAVARRHAGDRAGPPPGPGRSRRRPAPCSGGGRLPRARPERRSWPTRGRPGRRGARGRRSTHQHRSATPGGPRPTRRQRPAPRGSGGPGGARPGTFRSRHRRGARPRRRPGARHRETARAPGGVEVRFSLRHPRPERRAGPGPPDRAIDCADGGGSPWPRR